MSDYTLTPKEYARLKSNLTRAKGDVAKTLKACREAHAIFEEKGYPDDWARWQRAWEDLVTYPNPKPTNPFYT